MCLVPLYTPIRTDEPDQSIDQLFFGGVNVYLQQKFPAFRFLPRAIDRVLDRPALVSKLAGSSISVDAAQLGELTLSMVRGEHGNQRKEVRRLVDWLAQQSKIDVMNLSNLLIAGCVPALKNRLDGPIVVTLQGDDLFIDQLPDPYRQQVLAALRGLVAHVDRFIAHSRFYAQSMADYFDIPRDRIEVVPLGISLDDVPELAGDTSRPSTIGYLARICEAKGLHVLVDAFLRLKSQPATRDVRLHVAGWLGIEDQSYFDGLKARIDQAGFSDDFAYAGVLDRSAKWEFLQSLDVLSVPTTYAEPKGRYVLEALACGIPVVQPDHGAFPELLQRTGGGRLVTPNHPEHLAATLAELLSDPERRRQLGQEGRAAVFDQCSAEQAARRTLEVYARCLDVA